jgi:hypothetical protein
VTAQHRSLEADNLLLVAHTWLQWLLSGNQYREKENGVVRNLSINNVDDNDDKELIS